MKAVNPLRTKVLITTDEVFFHAPVDNNADVRHLLQAILIAEQRFIAPSLGYALYDTLCDKKNVLVDDGNRATLTTEINAGRPAGRATIELVNGDFVNSAEYLDARESVLWAKHLHKLIAETVYYCALPTNHSRFTAAGIVQDNPRTQVGNGQPASIELKDLKHLMDRTLQDRIMPLIEAMHGYMCGVKYPGYLRSCGCDEPIRRNSDVMFSMYDDPEDCGCKW